MSQSEVWEGRHHRANAKLPRNPAVPKRVGIWRACGAAAPPDTRWRRPWSHIRRPLGLECQSCCGTEGGIREEKRIGQSKYFLNDPSPHSLAIIVHGVVKSRIACLLMALCFTKSILVAQCLHAWYETDTAATTYNTRIRIETCVNSSSLRII